MKQHTKAVLESICVICGGAAAFVGYEIYTENPEFYSNCLLPTLHRILSAENAHRVAVKALSWNLLPKSRYSDDKSLHQSVWKREFRNPIGIAAGFDKDAEAMIGLSRMGFGFIEVGSITPLPQEGNPKPRVFRLREDRAVINRYGFNSCGHEAASHRLSAFAKDKDRGNVVLGVNLGKNKTSSDAVKDYVKGVQQLGRFADYLVINVSSPNTPGLRDLQQKKSLEELCKAIIAERDKLPNNPIVLIKIAPDLTDEDKQDIADVVLKFSVDGLIVSNTTVQRPPHLTSPNKAETGGLSGAPIRDVSTTLIGEMYKLTHGKVPIVGVGGVATGSDAYLKIKAGATLVQLYTAMVYGGPPVLTSIKKELVELLRRDGYENVSQAVGKGHR